MDQVRIPRLTELLVVSAIGFFGVSCAAAPVGAAGLAYQGWGLRGGLSFDPDQIVIGGHLDLGEFSPHWHFVPNIDLGIGDDVTLISISPDVTYDFPVKDVGSLYTGGILAFEWWNWDDHGRRQDDHSDSEIGLHGLIGLSLETPVFFELNIGLVDAPDVKLIVGYTFGK
jgi:hypothetical protein